MTLRGHKNHYNIKLLRGYGVSINIKQNKIILKNGTHDITGKQDYEEWFVTKIPYKKGRSIDRRGWDLQHLHQGSRF